MSARILSKSWFWSVLGLAGLLISYVFAFGRSTKEFEVLSSRVTAIEAANPEHTRWMVDQQTNFLQEFKGDIASIKASIRKIELSIARSNPTLGSKD